MKQLSKTELKKIKGGTLDECLDNCVAEFRECRANGGGASCFPLRTSCVVACRQQDWY